MLKLSNALEGYLSSRSEEGGSMRKGQECPVVGAVPVLGHPVPLQHQSTRSLGAGNLGRGWAQPSLSVGTSLTLSAQGHVPSLGASPPTMTQCRYRKNQPLALNGDNFEGPF